MPYLKQTRSVQVVTFLLLTAFVLITCFSLGFKLSAITTNISTRTTLEVTASTSDTREDRSYKKKAMNSTLHRKNYHLNLHQNVKSSNDSLGEITSNKRILNSTSQRECYHLHWNQSAITPKVIAKCGFIQLNRTQHQGDSGNQMFQVAALFGIAHSLDLIPVISETLPLLKYYNLPNVINIKLMNAEQCPEEKSWQKYTTCERSFSRVVNMTLTGYRQSWKYFTNIKRDVASIFQWQMKGQAVKNANNFMKNLPNNSVNIGIHVRRTDKLKHIQSNGFKTAGKDYYFDAMSFFKAFYNKINFIVMSDDMKWVKNNLAADNIFYSPFTNKTDDLALMSLCEHMILTYGSFGWWGAFMAGGTTINFDHWYKSPRRVNSYVDDDFFLPGSFLIGQKEVENV